MSCVFGRLYLLFALVLFHYLFCSCTQNLSDDLVLFSGKGLCIIGDSISTFQGSLVSDNEGYDGIPYEYYYPQGDVVSVEDMWWYKVGCQLGIPLSLINNCSWSGSTVTGDALSTASAFAGCSLKRIQDLSFNGFSPDIILCYISCNDWGRGVPMGYWEKNMSLIPSVSVSCFGEAYAIMLERIKTTYPNAFVFCMTNLVDRARDCTPGWPANNTNGVSVEEWNSALVEIASFYDFETIDINDCGITFDNLFE